jgi:hypothetical protein
MNDTILENVKINIRDVFKIRDKIVDQLHIIERTQSDFKIYWRPKVKIIDLEYYTGGGQHSLYTDKTIDNGENVVKFQKTRGHFDKTRSNNYISNLSDIPSRAVIYSNLPKLIGENKDYTINEFKDIIESYELNKNNIELAWIIEYFINSANKYVNIHSLTKNLDTILKIKGFAIYPNILNINNNRSKNSGLGVGGIVHEKLGTIDEVNDIWTIETENDIKLFINLISDIKTLNLHGYRYRDLQDKCRNIVRVKNKLVLIDLDTIYPWKRYVSKHNLLYSNKKNDSKSPTYKQTLKNKHYIFRDIVDLINCAIYHKLLIKSEDYVKNIDIHLHALVNEIEYDNNNADDNILSIKTIFYKIYDRFINDIKRKNKIKYIF